MIYSNESPHSQPSPPRIFFCYWDWCRLTFFTLDDLASHVRHNHIRKLQPMSKSEITLMRKWDAEEAQSMSDSLGSSVRMYHHKGRSQLAGVDSDQGSSASRSLDLSQAHMTEVLSPGPLTPPTTHNSTSPFPPERTPPLPVVHGVDLHRGSTALHTTPTRREFPNFAQLSSPADTSSIASLPRSPDLSTLSIRPNLAAQIDTFDQRHSRLNEVTRGDRLQSMHLSSSSQSSNSSQDAVERQLTQDDIMDVSVQIQKLEAVQDGTTELAALSTSESENPASVISGMVTDADANLQWPESEPELTTTNQPGQLSRPAEGDEAEHLEYHSPPVVLHSNRGRNFRSGTLHISPLSQRTKSRSAPQPPQTNIHSPQVSQETSGSGESQSSTHSYPLVLQTQAPYRSQSYELSLSQI